MEVATKSYYEGKDEDLKSFCNQFLKIKNIASQKKKSKYETWKIYIFWLEQVIWPR